MVTFFGGGLPNQIEVVRLGYFVTDVDKFLDKSLFCTMKAMDHFVNLALYGNCHVFGLFRLIQDQWESLFEQAKHLVTIGPFVFEGTETPFPTFVNVD